MTLLGLDIFSRDTKEKETEENTRSTPVLVSELESILNEELPHSRNMDLLIKYDQLKDIRELPCYAESHRDSRLIGFYARNKSKFDAHINVELESNTVSSISLRSITYTDSEISNDCVGAFARTFGYKDPYVIFDIESPNPTLTVHSS